MGSLSAEEGEGGELRATIADGFQCPLLDPPTAS